MGIFVKCSHIVKVMLYRYRRDMPNNFSPEVREMLKFFLRHCFQINKKKKQFSVCAVDPELSAGCLLWTKFDLTG